MQRLGWEIRAHVRENNTGNVQVFSASREELARVVTGGTAADMPPKAARATSCPDLSISWTSGYSVRKASTLTRGQSWIQGVSSNQQNYGYCRMAPSCMRCWVSRHLYSMISLEAGSPLFVRHASG